MWWQENIFSAAAATGTGRILSAIDRQHIVFTLSSASSGAFTVKFQWSNSDVAPDFSAARTTSNEWEYIQVKDYQNAAAIDGDTGIAFAGTDDVRIVELNDNVLKWVCATITAYSAGTVTLRVLWANNQ
jgi:hypothetical protein